MSAAFPIDHRLALVAFAALLIAAAAPLASAWARLLPEEPPPFELPPAPSSAEQTPSNRETRRKGDPFAIFLLLCVTLSFLLKFPAFPPRPPRPRHTPKSIYSRTCPRICPPAPSPYPAQTAWHSSAPLRGAPIRIPRCRESCARYPAQPPAPAPAAPHCRPAEAASPSARATNRPNPARAAAPVAETAAALHESAAPHPPLRSSPLPTSCRTASIPRQSSAQIASSPGTRA